MVEPNRHRDLKNYQLPFFSLYIHVTIFMIFGFLGIISFVIGLTALFSSAPVSMNILREYIPDENTPNTKLEGYCAEHGYQDDFLSTDTFYCIFYLQYQPDILFSNVNVKLINNIRDSVAYTVRQNAITIGDLIFLWGEPIVIGCKQVADLCWNDGDILAHISKQNRGFYHFLPVSRIVISHEVLNETS